MRRKISFAKAGIIQRKDDFSRPFCGWYDIVRVKLSENGAEYSVPESDCTVLLLEINISQFSGREIPDQVLCDADRIISEIGRKYSLILRWVYDWDGDGKTAEPEKIDTVLRHIAQTGSVSVRHRDNILTTQGLLIGSWGEMHSSKFLSYRSLDKLLGAMLDAYPGIPAAIRTPAIREKLSLGRVGNMSRIGIFNDGIMGSANDLGSYDMPRDKAAAYFARSAEGVPYGGEIVCGDDFDSNECLSYLRQSAATYLNRGHDINAISILKKQMYDGITAYDYIGGHIGYRVVIEDVGISGDTLRIRVKNIGFAANYRPLEVYVRYQKDSGSDIIICIGDRFIRSGETAEYTTQLPDSNAKAFCIMTIGGRHLQPANVQTSDGVLLGDIGYRLF